MGESYSVGDQIRTALPRIGGDACASYANGLSGSGPAPRVRCAMSEPTRTELRQAYAAGWRDAVSLAALRIRAYEGSGADDAIRELEHMFNVGPEQMPESEP